MKTLSLLQMMKQFKNLSQNTFLRSVSLLVSGTIIAQLFSYALAPLISRLFTPEEMGEFGVFQRIVVFIATIATARYEFALPLPKNDQHSFQLFRLSLGISLYTIAVSIPLFLVYGVFTKQNSEYQLWVLLLLLAVFFLVFFNLGTNWAIRHKAFKRISYSKMTNSLSLNGLRVIFGFLQWGKWGLYLSFVLSLAVGAFHYLGDFLHWNKTPRTQLSRKKMQVLAKAYKDFPFANLPHAMFDTLRDVIVAFVIISFFSEKIFGSFDHSFRMLRLPIMLIGSSISQVFFNQISTLKNEKQVLFPKVKKLTFLLFALSIIPFSIVALYGEPLFAWIFGEEWREAGMLSEIMMPWLMLNFIISPLSIIPIVLGKQKAFFWVGLSASLLQLAGFAILPGFLKDDWILTFQIVTWTQVLIALITLFFHFKWIRTFDSSLQKSS